MIITSLITLSIKLQFKYYQVKSSQKKNTIGGALIRKLIRIIKPCKLIKKMTFASTFFIYNIIHHIRNNLSCLMRNLLFQWKNFICKVNWIHFCCCCSLQVHLWQCARYALLYADYHPNHVSTPIWQIAISVRLGKKRKD